MGCSLDDTRKVFGSHQEAETWAYRICMMWCMDLIGELIDENWSGEKVDFFHEQSDRFNSVAQSAFKAMTANDSLHRKYFSSMTAVRWQDHIATQPADMLAFEALKVINLDIASGEHLGDEPTDTEKMRKSLQSIIGKRVPLRVRYYTEPNLSRGGEAQEEHGKKGSTDDDGGAVARGQCDERKALDQDGVGLYRNRNMLRNSSSIYLCVVQSGQAFVHFLIEALFTFSFGWK